MSKLVMLCAAVAVTMLTVLAGSADARQKRVHVMRYADRLDYGCAYERSYGGYCVPGDLPARRGYYGGRYYMPVYYGQVPSLYRSMASPMFPFR